MNHQCPVCGFAFLPYPPADYHICPCCSTEFENDDVDYSHHQLREAWIAGGARWFFGQPPAHWNPWLQLIKAGYGAEMPWFSRATHLYVEAYATVVAAPTVRFIENGIFAETAA